MPFGGGRGETGRGETGRGKEERGDKGEDGREDDGEYGGMSVDSRGRGEGGGPETAGAILKTKS